MENSKCFDRSADKFDGHRIIFSFYGNLGPQETRIATPTFTSTEQPLKKRQCHKIDIKRAKSKHHNTDSKFEKISHS